MQIRRRALTAWESDIAKGWGERAARSARAVVPMLDDALAGAAGLHTVGAALAQQGYPLDEVIDWFGLLGRRCRAWRTRLGRGHGASLATGWTDLAAGWADGVLRDDHGRRVVAPLDALRLRLRQQIGVAHTISEAPGRHLALVVVDGAGTDTAAVLDHVRAIFGHSESLAVTAAGAVIVLTARDHELRRHTLRLTDSLHHDGRLQGSMIRVWIEPLAMSAEHVESHLLGLAG